MHHRPLFLPVSGLCGRMRSLSETAESAAIEAYLQSCVAFARSSFGRIRSEYQGPVADVADLLAVLLGRAFNYQSKSKCARFAQDAAARFACAVASGGPIRLHLLYHGGYRADPAAGAAPLTFRVDATELMLIHQAARFHASIANLHAPGAEITLVINNGVAEYVNEIPIAATRAYVRRLERLIAALGAESRVKVLAQSDLGPFEQRMQGIAVTPWPTVDPMHMRIVQRFLGRPCSEDEARLRAAVYDKAEEVWGGEVRAIIDRERSVCVRQIASEAALSFRSFPGGAARVQNGTIGFEVAGEKVVPRLVTATTRERRPVIEIPLRNPIFAEANEAAQETAA